MRIATAMVVAAALVLAACQRGGATPAAGGRGGPGGRGPVAFPVEASPVAVRKVEFTVPAVGSVQAFEQVQITARVAGSVEKVLFAEGDKVAKGQALALIEQDRYQVAVRSAKAALEKAEASLAEAQAGVTRREEASQASPGLIRGEELETWRTRARTAAAEVSQAKAALETAQINLRDSQVRAPAGGIVQTRTVQTGQYVQPGAVLATMVRREPLLLRFQVPERDAARLRTGMLARFKTREGADSYEARITNVGETADEATRMVVVTARVEDPKKDALRAGAFAEVSVPVGMAEAPVIPQTAVRPSERGFLAFVVEGNTAKERVLTLGMRTEEGLVEVRNGLRPGEVLVVRGAEALRDGVQVRTEKKGGPQAAAGQGSAPGAPANAPTKDPGGDANSPQERGR